MFLFLFNNFRAKIKKKQHRMLFHVALLFCYNDMLPKTKKKGLKAGEHFYHSGQRKLSKYLPKNETNSFQFGMKHSFQKVCVGFMDQHFCN